jgi:hypothetical protein
LPQNSVVTEVVQCPSCANRSHMKVLAECHHVDRFRAALEDPEEGTEYQLVLCPACHGVGLRSSDWINVYEWERNFRFLYPILPGTIRGLPEQVKKEYDSALRVRPIDTNAFAVMLGRVLDAVCADRGAKGRTLSERLKDLAKQGAIPGKLADMAHSVRHLRNVGAHADLGEITGEEVPILDDLCRAVLEYVYAAPELLRAIQEKIDKRKNGAVVSDGTKEEPVDF